MLQPGAIAMVGQILRPWLDQHLLSPFELLCQKDLLVEIRNNTAVYNAAVYAAAQMQADAKTIDAATRNKDLQRFLEDYLRAVGNETIDLIAVGSSSFATDFESRVEAVGGVTARRHLIFTLSHFLAKSPSFGAKVERLLVLLEKCQNQEIRRVLDEFLASFIVSDAARADTFVDEGDPFALLHDFMGLISAQAQPRRGACKLIQRLTFQMSQFDLPHSRAAFQKAFDHGVGHTRNFASPGKLTGKKHVMWELGELSKLHKKMAVTGGWFASPDLVMAMETQVARRTGSLQLDEYTADQQGIFAKTLELLKIYPLVFGDRNIARFDSRIYENMTRHDLSRLLDQCARSPMDQLGLYGLLEQKIRKANMGMRITNEMVGHLAQLQETFIREKQVFHKFRFLRTGTSEKGIYVLEMLILGAFTAGRCRRAAIKLMQHFLPSKQRLLEAINETQGVETDVDRSEELCAMYDYFVSSM